MWIVAGLLFYMVSQWMPSSTEIISDDLIPSLFLNIYNAIIHMYNIIYTHIIKYIYIYTYIHTCSRYDSIIMGMDDTFRGLWTSLWTTKNTRPSRRIFGIDRCQGTCLQRCHHLQPDMASWLRTGVPAHGDWDYPIYEGFHGHGGTPIAGWFMSWKIPSRSGWYLGVPPFQETSI